MKFNRKAAVLIILFAILVQTIIIVYNQLTGFIHISGFLEFGIRLFIGTFFSSIFGIITIFIDLKLINGLENKFTWQHKPILRFIYECLAAVFVGIAIGSTVTLAAHIVFPYDNPAFHLINNSLITIVLNIIIVVVLEAIIYFKLNRESSIKAEILEKEITQIKLETLKNQLNPHFLFNSLNVLSALVKKDSGKAETFIDEFSSIYRYILDVIDKPVVEVKEELSFAKSYLYLQQIRFENGIKTDINIEASKLKYFVPPLAIQTLLENSLKHNKATSDNPLFIEIKNEGEFLLIKNNLQPKFRNNESKGIGLENLKKRYKLISGIEPEFILHQNEYVAKLPLINLN